MVKKLSLASSTQELEEKGENVHIDEKSDAKSLLRYVKSACVVFTSAESAYRLGDEERAYMYFVKYFSVYSQLRSTAAYINNNRSVEEEMKKTLPINMCKTALARAEKLKKSLEKRYADKRLKEMEVAKVETEKVRLEALRDQELAELERLKLEAAQPAVDAATLFTTTTVMAPLVPIGQSLRDTITKEPFISPIELMHIIEAKMKVLLIDIRTLDEFKNSHVIHEAVIFLSKDYLEVSTKLTSNEIRDLILMKDHKKLWDKRSSYDVIVVFDTDSQYSAVTELPNHPINIIRECSVDCLHPNFMNSDLPKFLDGGYACWVYHFPKFCTNPDRAKRTLKKGSKSRRSAPASLRPLPIASAPAIYPELNKDSESKPASLTVPPPAAVASGTVITSGNLQISMPQSPQTIQINQWNRDQGPAELRPDEVTTITDPAPRTLPDFPKYPPEPQPRAAEVRPPAPSELGRVPVKPGRSCGSLTITDIYESTQESGAANNGVDGSSRIAQSRSTPNVIYEDSMTTFPSKARSTQPEPAPEPLFNKVQPKTPAAAAEPIYAKVETRKKVPSSALAPSTPGPKQTTEYADISSIRAAVEAVPVVDRSVKPRVSPTPPIQAVAPGPRPALDLHKPPPPAASPSISVNRPDPTQANQVFGYARPSPTPSTKQQPTQPPVSTPVPSNTPPDRPVRNPTVNRVVKPLSARALDEKFMRMTPAYGSVQLGTCGLKNIGNTCFMAAVLQCLSATAPLTHYFNNNKHKQEINSENPLGTQGLVAEEYAFLIRAMWSDRFRFLAPKDWKEAIGKFRPQFLDYSQKDAQEFTSFMLDALHEDLNRVREKGKLREIDYKKLTYKEGARAAWDLYREHNNSIVVDLFQGQFRNITRCLRCGYESVTFDTFMYLSVPVGKSRTDLTRCIENFCQQEQIEWRCDKCHVLGNATKDITIWRLPQILVVILKRFSYSGMWRDKISTLVDFPVSDFRAFGGEVSWLSNPEQRRVYRLFGVTNHTGTLEGGHYIGCARNPLSGDWFTYDDHVIRPMKADAARKKEAYLLFYTSLSEAHDKELVR